MSWFGSTPSIDEKVDRATSESLPSGEQDLALNLDICDMIRSKAVPPKDAMRSLKRRLIHKNPNVQILALHLIDVCIKNGGNHFLAEISSREFMDSFVQVLKSGTGGTVNPQVKTLMLEYLQNWAHAFQGQIQHGYVNKVYEQLKSEGFPFPTGAVINASFIDSSSPPEWTDSDTCMKCGESFTFVNRKHHCRNCGRVFDQKHCNNYISLPHYGIYEPVRVCDDCYEELKAKSGDSADRKSVSSNVENTKSTSSRTYSNNESLRRAPTVATSGGDDSEDEDFKRALQLSLEESNKGMNPPSSSHNSVASTTAAVPSISMTTSAEEDEEDDDMKAAIAASLQDLKISKQQEGGRGGDYYNNDNSNNNNDNTIYNSSTSGLYELPSTTSNIYSSQSFDQQQQSNDYHNDDISSSNNAVSLPSINNTDLDSLEIEIMYRYIHMVESMQNAPPGTILHDTKVQQLNENVSQLRPKLARSLRETVEKCDKLEELHGKMTAVARYWDRLLEDRLSHTYRWSQDPQYGQQSQPIQQMYYAESPPNQRQAPPQTDSQLSSPTNQNYQYNNYYGETNNIPNSTETPSLEPNYNHNSSLQGGHTENTIYASPLNTEQPKQQSSPPETKQASLDAVLIEL